MDSRTTWTGYQSTNSRERKKKKTNKRNVTFYKMMMLITFNDNQTIADLATFWALTNHFSRVLRPGKVSLKNITNSWPSAANLQNFFSTHFSGLSTMEKFEITLEQIFFTVGQNNYGNKIPNACACLQEK
jgi:hypothetical protein